MAAKGTKKASGTVACCLYRWLSSITPAALQSKGHLKPHTRRPVTSPLVELHRSSGRPCSIRMVDAVALAYERQESVPVDSGQRLNIFTDHLASLNHSDADHCRPAGYKELNQRRICKMEHASSRLKVRDGCITLVILLKQTQRSAYESTHNHRQHIEPLEALPCVSSSLSTFVWQAPSVTGTQ
ncbi:TPA: hypothetical protein ACH3X1_003582 [Trebouxia sp. C0004]